MWWTGWIWKRPRGETPERCRNVHRTDYRDCDCGQSGRKRRRQWRLHITDCRETRLIWWKKRLLISMLECSCFYLVLFIKKNVNLFCIFIIFRFISLNFSFIIFVFVLVFFLLFLNVLFWCPHVPTLDHLQRWWTQTTRGTKKIRLREEFAQNSPS